LNAAAAALDGYDAIGAFFKENLALHKGGAKGAGCGEEISPPQWLFFTRIDAVWCIFVLFLIFPGLFDHELR